MIIKKTDQEYTVTELTHGWTMQRVSGRIVLEYKLSKDVAPTFEALEKYIADHAIL